MKLSLYVSDHGYGHATRSIAVARALVAAGDGGLSVEVVNHHAHGLLRQALAGLRGVKVLDRPTDVGFVCREDRLAFDTGRTAISVWNWLSSWKTFVAEEVSRLRQSPPDLIVSDVAPQPLLVAEKLGVPSVITSNFNWVDQYEPHLRPDLVAPLRGSYALASRAHAYSMRTALSGVRHIVPAGLVTREPGRSREEVRRQLGVPLNAPLVHLGFGWSADAAALAADLDASALPAAARMLVSSNLAALGETIGPAERWLVIPQDAVEAHEYLAACDLIIAKAGYGTVAEAIAAKVPILAVPVDGSPESQVIALSVAELGVGVAYPGDQPLGASLFQEGGRMLSRIDRYRDAYRRLPSEFAPGAAARLARALLETAETLA